MNYPMVKTESINVIMRVFEITKVKCDYLWQFIVNHIAIKENVLATSQQLTLILNRVQIPDNYFKIINQFIGYILVDRYYSNKKYSLFISN